MSESELRGRVLSTLRTRLFEMRYTLDGMVAGLDGADPLCDPLMDAEHFLGEAQGEIEKALAANP